MSHGMKSNIISNLPDTSKFVLHFIMIGYIPSKLKIIEITGNGKAKILPKYLIGISLNMS